MAFMVVQLGCSAFRFFFWVIFTQFRGFQQSLDVLDGIWYFGLGRSGFHGCFDDFSLDLNFGLIIFIFRCIWQPWKVPCQICRWKNLQVRRRRAKSAGKKISRWEDAIATLPVKLGRTFDTSPNFMAFWRSKNWPPKIAKKLALESTENWFVMHCPPMVASTCLLGAIAHTSRWVFAVTKAVVWAETTQRMIPASHRIEFCRKGSKVWIKTSKRLTLV